jgi:hypothetical protein
MRASGSEAKTLDGGEGRDRAFIDHQFGTADLSFIMVDAIDVMFPGRGWPALSCD